MIPQAYINEWQQVVPWKVKEQVEQDLIISRALVAIYSSDFLRERLAFRGGTALHKLFLQPQARYSEDIDLVQIRAESVGETLDVLREVLNFLGKPTLKQKANNTTLVFKFETEFEPKIMLKLKVEINCREHFTVFGLQNLPFEVNSRWFKGKADIVTFSLEELLSTKLRALYQRRKGRDLFDLWCALENNQIDIGKVILSWQTYMKEEGNKITQSDFISNIEAKIKDPDFKGDVLGLLRPEIEKNYDIDRAYEIVFERVIGLLG
jgi:predicted nucleotidyltransferase component of viral defense system